MSFNLDRFIRAQADHFETARAELEAGRKRTHWMWFIFPQIAGLGHSPMAQFYAISDREEADAYRRHPVLGARLCQCTECVLVHRERRIQEIFGPPDDLKFFSCMTLFALFDDASAPFADALDAFFDGKTDEATNDILARQSGAA